MLQTQTIQKFETRALLHDPMTFSTLRFPEKGTLGISLRPKVSCLGSLMCLTCRCLGGRWIPTPETGGAPANVSRAVFGWRLLLKTLTLGVVRFFSFKTQMPSGTGETGRGRRLRELAMLDIISRDNYGDNLVPHTWPASVVFCQRAVVHYSFLCTHIRS